MKLQVALYLFPVNISEAPYKDVIPSENMNIMKGITHFIVENVRTARRFIKKCNPETDISQLTFYELNNHTPENEVTHFLDPLRNGIPMGVMSEAGCPGVADPGAMVVMMAQKEGYRVIPLVGPSSILMALMASGLNGQRFCFHGYLPVETSQREKRIRELESISKREDMTQIFIETPYRNTKMMESLIKILRGDTMLCVAANVTDPDNEKIITRSVAEWRKKGITLDKVPSIFLFYS